MNSIFTLIVEKSKLTLPPANEKQGMLTGVPLPPPTHCAALSHAVCLVPLLFICIYLSMQKAESTTCLLLTHPGTGVTSCCLGISFIPTHQSEKEGRHCHLLPLRAIGGRTCIIHGQINTVIDLTHLCRGLAKLCAVPHEWAAASYHPAFSTQQLGEPLCLDKSAFHRWREGTDLIRLSEGAQKSFLCTDQSTLALCSEQWWLSHKWPVPAFSRWLTCIWDSLYSNLQRAWHTQSPPSSPSCSSEPDLWQELPKAALTSLCSAKCKMPLKTSLQTSLQVYADHFTHKSNCAPVPGCCRCMWWDCEGSKTQVASDFSSAWSLCHFLGWGQRAVSSLVACTVHRLRAFTMS